MKVFSIYSIQIEGDGLFQFISFYRPVFLRVARWQGVVGWCPQSNFFNSILNSGFSFHIIFHVQEAVQISKATSDFQPHSLQLFFNIAKMIFYCSQLFSVAHIGIFPVLVFVVVCICTFWPSCNSHNRSKIHFNCQLVKNIIFRNRKPANLFEKKNPQNNNYAILRSIFKITRKPSSGDFDKISLTAATATSPVTIATVHLDSISKEKIRTKMDTPVLFAYPIYLIILFSTLHSVQGLGKIIFAVNAGGDSHVDIYGIKYQKGTSFFLFTSSRRCSSLLIAVMWSLSLT